MKKCLVFYEKNNEKYAVDLLGAACQMYPEGIETFALSVHADNCFAAGRFDTVISVTDERIKDYDLKNITGIIQELYQEYDFDCILIPATQTGRMLAPRAAMRLGTGLVADVTEISHEDGKLMMVRPAFSGKIMAGITNTSYVPVMMSVRPGIFTYEDTHQKNTVYLPYVPKQVTESGIKRITRQEKTASADIRECEILISGGGGVVNDMDLLKELADRMDAGVSASRAVVDKGKADRSIQVGQSGKIVHPKLYIAAGIYGAIQHIAGLQKVEHLIAINTNPESPICALADMVVEGDAKTFIQKLIQKIDEKQ